MKVEGLGPVSGLGPMLFLGPISGFRDEGYSLGFAALVRTWTALLR